MFKFGSVKQTSKHSHSDELNLHNLFSQKFFSYNFQMSNTDLLNKTWTLSGSEENLSEEIFSDIPPSPQHATNINNLTQQITRTRHDTMNLTTSPESHICYKSERFTSFTLSPRSTTFVKEPEHVSQYRSLSVDLPSHSSFAHIENFFEICNSDEFISLFDENTSGLDFE